jgi:hypothetical protein
MIKRILNQTEEVIEDVSTNIHLQFDFSEVKLAEDEKDGKKSKKAQICLIKAGWNSNGYFFEEEQLEEILQLMQKRPKIYLNHDYFGMGRSESDWAASYLKTWKEGKALYGDIRFTENPHTVWIFNEIKEDPKTVQFSIDIAAVVEPMDTPDKQQGQKVTKVMLYRSTDIVSYAAAGGEAIKILNEQVLAELNKIHSFVKPKKEIEDMVEIKSIADLRAAHPGLVEQLLNEDKAKMAADQKIVQLESEVTSLKTSETALKAQVETEKTEKVALEAKITTLTAEKAALVTEKDALVVKVDAFETSVRLSEWQKTIDKAIEDSKIDKKLVTPVFLEQLKKLDKVEEVNKLIEDRKGLTSVTILNGIKSEEKLGDDGKPVPITDDLLVVGIKS